jgi:hypothetical protein
MILARIQLLGLSSESDKIFQVKMHDVCISDTRELSVELPQAFMKGSSRDWRMPSTSRSNRNRRVLSLSLIFFRPAPIERDRAAVMTLCEALQ